jgi:hypothetical protein
MTALAYFDPKPLWHCSKALVHGKTWAGSYSQASGGNGPGFNEVCFGTLEMR